MNEKIHEPVALPDGRDGEALREWLKRNKNIKVVTRDRASAYAKVISEELPDAMQVADRFHLHQNLLEAIKKALNQELPATVTSFVLIILLYRKNRINTREIRLSGKRKSLGKPKKVLLFCQLTENIRLPPIQQFWGDVPQKRPLA